jgi:hypothetical protein
MAPNEKLLFDTIKVTLATYVETRRRTRDDVRKAIDELKTYVPQLIRETNMNSEREAPHFFGSSSRSIATVLGTTSRHIRRSLLARCRVAGPVLMLAAGHQ